MDTDRGSTSLTTVLLTPVFLVIALMAFQAAMWSHARAQARAVARSSAVLVARDHAGALEIEQSVETMLTSGTDLVAVDVEIDVDDDLVTARITARAPGLVRGTSTEFVVIELVPRERFRP